MAFEQFRPASEVQGQSANDVLSNHAFTLAQESHPLAHLAIAGGAGMFAGAGLTGLGEIGTVKLTEPLFRPMIALGFGMLGAGRFTGGLLNAPASTALESLQMFGPKPIVAGALIGAAIGIGGYELYEHLKQS